MAILANNDTLRQIRDDAQTQYALLHEMARQASNPLTAKRLMAEANTYWNTFVVVSDELVNTDPDRAVKLRNEE